MNRTITVLFIIALIFVYIEKPFPTQHLSTTTTTLPMTNEQKKQSILTTLRSVEGNHILSGQHISWKNNSEVNKLYNLYNVRPYIIETELSWNCNAERQDLWLNQTKAGGLVMMSNHQDNPKTNTRYSYNDYDINISQILIEGTIENINFKKYYDDRMSCLQFAKENGIIILFRAFHEMNCCFWWRNSPDLPKLWRYTYNYLVNVKGLDNLLWVYGPNCVSGNYLTYYPGDNYVDIVSLDCYSNNMDKVNQGYNEMISTGKPFGFTEWSPYPASGLAINNYSAMSWMNATKTRFNKATFFSTWGGDVFPVYNWIDAGTYMNSEYVITLGER